MAVKNNDIDFVKHLIEKEEYPSYATNLHDFNNWTPLHYASALGNVEICELLIERGGANPHLKTSLTGLTAFHIAVMYGQIEVLLFFKRIGVDSFLSDFYGRTPMDITHERLFYNDDESRNFVQSIICL
jgi:ankyrin repeat protein